MEFSELIKKRRACHTFIPGNEVKDEHIEKMIQEAGMSPSGYNAQPWEFIVIKSPENISKLHEIAYKQKHIKDAGAIIIVLGDSFIGRNVDKLLQDWVKYGYCSAEEIPVFKNSIAKNRKPEKLKSMALRNAMLACMTLIYSAENLGYETCPIMGFNHTDIENFLEIPEDRVIALMIAIGKGDKEKEKTRLPRKALSEIVHYEKFQNKDA